MSFERCFVGGRVWASIEGWDRCVPRAASGERCGRGGDPPTDHPQLFDDDRHGKEAGAAIAATSKQVGLDGFALDGCVVVRPRVWLDFLPPAAASVLRIKSNPNTSNSIQSITSKISWRARRWRQAGKRRSRW